jgi:hypothetical protein
MKQFAAILAIFIRGYACFLLGQTFLAASVGLPALIREQSEKHSRWLSSERSVQQLQDEPPGAANHSP